MATRRFLLGYVGATFALWCVMTISQSCFEWQNTHQIPDIQRRDLCLDAFRVSSCGVILLQLACIGMMAFPSPIIGQELRSGTRVAVASLAVIVLLTNPWTAILLVVMFGGALS